MQMSSINRVAHSGVPVFPEVRLILAIVLLAYLNAAASLASH